MAQSSSQTEGEVSGQVTTASGDPIVGAHVVWCTTQRGALTAEDGSFSLPPFPSVRQLVVSYVGYVTDTVMVEDLRRPLRITLYERSEQDALDQVVVSARVPGQIKSSGLMNTTSITRAELCRAACCNLGESFSTNPSVDVSYTDAATGAQQIRLLGLSGTYVQMLTENIPNFRGVAAPYALGYVPGPWMQSIQVSKGSASVKNGYESITGQINIEYLKPQTDEQVDANLYGDTKGRYEVNADVNHHFTDRLSSALLLHYEDRRNEHDGNGDGFMDSPKIRQINLLNRWAWMGERDKFQAALKVLDEERNSGQSAHGASMPTEHLYTIGLKTRRYEAFVKNAVFLNAEHNTNVALILSGTYHSMEGTYGHKLYDVDQKTGYASLLYESDVTPQQNLSAGLSWNYDRYDQRYRLTHTTATPTEADETESVPGAYVQYTYHIGSQWVAMAGVRVDHSDRYGTFWTPRAHLKWAPTEQFSLRASAGKGYRTVHPLAENNQLLSSGRRLVIDDLQQEEAWNYGLSATWNIPIGGQTLQLNGEYYYTRFQHQMLVDYDSDVSEIRLTNLQGRSFSHTVQVDATYPFGDQLTVTAAYRYNDVRATYAGRLRERPLTNRYKGLLTASYKPGLGLWQLDVTGQLNGGGRIPTAEPSRFGSYEQVSAQLTRWFRRWSIYVGGENLTGRRQHTPILAADDPWSERFEPTLVWGPIHGAMFYAGVRWHLGMY
jgi:outer membrane receptor protein involved in Fe transport